MVRGPSFKKNVRNSRPCKVRLSKVFRLKFRYPTTAPPPTTHRKRETKQTGRRKDWKKTTTAPFVKLTSYTGNKETFKICLVIILFRKCTDRNLFKGCLAFPTDVKWQTAKYYSSPTLASCCQTIEKTLKSWQIWLGITTFRLFVSLWSSIFQLQS